MMKFKVLPLLALLSIASLTGCRKSTDVKFTYDDVNFIPILGSKTNDEEYDDVVVNKIEGLREDFAMGVDASMVLKVEEQGGVYYNDDGVEQDVFQIMADHGVNFFRVRIWNNPFNKYGEGFGGGDVNVDRAIEMATRAKAAGMKLLLDYHFSDFWADPGKQVMPKDWADLPSSADVAMAINEYVQTTLTSLQQVDALPDMVQLGNETTNGMFTSYPGGTNTSLTGDNPYYISQRSSISSSISAPNGSANLHLYMSAALDAVNTINPDILTMIHIAKGMTGIDFIKNYYHQFDDLDYDIIGLSGYSYYHFQNGLTTLQNCLNAVSSEFPAKKITIAETAYGFTYAPHAWASNIFSRSGGQALSGYDVSVQGQANLIRDIIAAVASLSNGYGVFYWEGAWLPLKGAGWADANSKCSWANQTFFTYDGATLPSLDLFTQIKG